MGHLCSDTCGLEDCIELSKFVVLVNSLKPCASATESLILKTVTLPAVLNPQSGELELLEVQALIDTGASHSLVDPTLAERLMPTCITGKPISSRVKLANGEIVEAKLQKLRAVLQIDDQEWTPATLLSWTAMKGSHPIIIGMDFFRANRPYSISQSDADDRLRLTYTAPEIVDPTTWAADLEREAELEEESDKPTDLEDDDQVVTLQQFLLIQAFMIVNERERTPSIDLHHVDALPSPALGGEDTELVTIEELDGAEEQQALDKLAEPFVQRLMDEFAQDVLSTEPCSFENSDPHQVGEQTIRHDIELKPEAEPFRSRVIRQSAQATREMVRMLRDLQKRGLYYKCESQWSSPCFLVRKKSGKFRLVSNYKKLNEVTRTYPHHIPLIEDILQALANATILSAMDVSDSFFIVRNSKRAEKYSALETPLGCMCPTRMQQGLVGSPWTLQRLFTAIFEIEIYGSENAKDEKGVVTKSGMLAQYFDDLTVHSTGPPTLLETVEDHYVKVRHVLLKLKEHTVPLNPAKLRLFKLYQPLLGYIVGEGKVMMERSKVTQILKMEPPKGRTDVRRLLGLVQHNKAFLKGLSEITAPLSKLTGKEEFKWKEELHGAAFEALKKALVSAPLLHLPRGDGAYVLETDASDSHVGGSLFQNQRDPNTGEERLVTIGNFSKKLSPNQTQWPTHQQELLAIVYACEQYDHLLKFNPGVTIYTDSKAAESLLTKDRPLESPNISESRLMQRLNNYRGIIRYRKGELNAGPDFLSRPCGSDSYILRVLDCAAGLGSTLLAIERLAERGLLRLVEGISYTAIEKNPIARSAILMNYRRIYERYPKLFNKRPHPKRIFSPDHDLRKLAESKMELNYDIVLCGADCRAFSDAQGDKAPGMSSDKELFTPLAAIIQRIRKTSPGVLWMVECTIFGRIFKGHQYTKHLKGDWEKVKTRFGELGELWENMVDFGDHFLPQTRRRQMMTNFEVPKEWPTCDETYSHVLAPLGGKTKLRKAKTVMAGLKSATRRLELNNYKVGNRTVAPSPETEEVLQGLKVGSTAVPGISEKDRRSLIGNAWSPLCIEFLLEAALKDKRVFNDFDEPDITIDEGTQVYLWELRAMSMHLAGDVDKVREKILAVAPQDHAYWGTVQRLRQNGGETDTDLQKLRLVDQNEQGGIIVEEQGQLRIPVSDSNEGKALIQEVCSLIHDEFHSSIANDMRFAKARVSWPTMQKDMEDYVKSCQKCYTAKVVTQSRRIPLRPLPVSAGPGVVLSCDFLAMPEAYGTWFGTLMSFSGVMVIKCTFTKYAVFVPFDAKHMPTEKVARIFMQAVLPIWGTSMRALVTDRDRRFESRLWRWLEGRLGITGRRTTSARPQADGSSERAFRSLLQHLRIELCQPIETDGQTDREMSGLTWVDLLPVAEYTYNASRHSATGSTPFFLERGREPTRALDVLRQEEPGFPAMSEEQYQRHAEKLHKAMTLAYQRTSTAQEKANKMMERRNRNPATEARQTFEPGDLVFAHVPRSGVRDKLSSRQDGPFKVVRQRYPGVYEVERENATSQRVFNADRLTRFCNLAEAIEKFPLPRWESPTVGPSTGMPYPYLIEHVDFAQVPPSYRVKHGYQSRPVLRHEDELVAGYADAEASPSALRNFILGYLRHKSKEVLPEVNVPNQQREPIRYERYVNHRVLLYDRSPLGIGPQYYRSSSPSGLETLELTSECAERASLIRHGDTADTPVEEAAESDEQRIQRIRQEAEEERQILMGRLPRAPQSPEDGGVDVAALPDSDNEDEEDSLPDLEEETEDPRTLTWGDVHYEDGTTATPVEYDHRRIASRLPEEDRPGQTETPGRVSAGGIQTRSQIAFWEPPAPELEPEPEPESEPDSGTTQVAPEPESPMERSPDLPDPGEDCSDESDEPPLQGYEEVMQGPVPIEEVDEDTDSDQYEVVDN